MESYGDFYFIAVKKKRLEIFDENFKDWSSNCP
jgi:hypothetical protein